MNFEKERKEKKSRERNTAYSEGHEPRVRGGIKVRKGSGPACYGVRAKEP